MSKRTQANGDGVLFDRRDVGLDDLILAIRPAVAAAEERDEPVDILGVLAAHRPVQATQPGPAFRRTFERRHSLFILLHPLRAFGDKQHDRVGPVDQFRAILPLAVGLHERDFDPLGRLEDFLKHLEAVHVFVRRRRMAVGALADEEELLRGVGESGIAAMRKRSNERTANMMCIQLECSTHCSGLSIYVCVRAAEPSETGFAHFPFLAPHYPASGEGCWAEGFGVAASNPSPPTALPAAGRAGENPRGPRGN